MLVNFKHLVAHDFKLLAMSTVEEEIEGNCLPSAKPHFLFQPERGAQFAPRILDVVVVRGNVTSLSFTIRQNRREPEDL